MRQRPTSAFLAILIMAVIVAVGSCLCLPKMAAAATAAPQQSENALSGVSQESLKQLSATLQDPQKRQALIDQIDALVQLQGKTQPQETPLPVTLTQTLVEGATLTARQTRATLVELAGYLGQLPQLSGWLETLVSSPLMRDWALRLLRGLLTVLALPFLFELVLRRLLRGTARSLDRRPSDAITAKVPLVILRALLDIVPVAGFLGAAYLALFILAPLPQIGFLALDLAFAYVLSRAILIVARRLLAPRAPALRLMPIGDDGARLAYGWVRRFTVTAVLGYFLIEIGRLLGLPGSVYLLLLRLLGLVLVAIAIAFILRARAPVARVIRDGHAPLLPKGVLVQQLRNGIAALWHLAAIVYVIVVFVVIGWQVENGGTYLLRGTIGSLLLFAIASTLMAWLDQVVRRKVRVTDGEMARQPGARERLRSYAMITSHVLRAVIALAALLGILYLWGVDTPAWLELPFPRFVLRVAGTAIVATLIGVIVWEMVSAAVERALRAREGEETATARHARLHTILPLLRKVVLVVLAVMITLMVLSEAGIDIGPLIAGAGVVGLAIGFGAQRLVQDIITGIFILVEDAVSVGDVVTVAGIGGLVEDLSIRSLKLRDLQGSVHTIPFSSVSTVTNMTKVFSYFVANIGVAYREDTDEVFEVCKKIVEEMRQEPKYRRSILEPLEVLGVDSFADSAVILKARIKTRPIKQWEVGREFNRRMKKRFDELGIEIPFPHVTLYFGEDKKGESPAGRVRLSADELLGKMRLTSEETLARLEGLAKERGASG